MNNSKGNNSIIEDKPTIVIDENASEVPGQGQGETPVLTIESDDSIADSTLLMPAPSRRSRWLLAATAAIATALVCTLAAGGYLYYRYHIAVGVPVSADSKTNIAKLQQPLPSEAPAVVMKSDSILGVGLNMYELRGLQAEISFTEPTPADSDVYLYSRSSDFTSYDPKANQYLGSLVVNGNVLQSNTSRRGYCAMANGHVLIGVARDEKVRDYCAERGGSFFRQFILVSDGVLPPRFYLHGKVERRALGSMGGKLYYIESRGKQGMYEFADALREYGFTDAIYITGGSDYCFYRTADGRVHDIGLQGGDTDTRHKGCGIVPWLVFKRRQTAK